MKNKAFMVSIILAASGFFLIGLSLFLLFKNKGSNVNDDLEEELSKVKLELNKLTDSRQDEENKNNTKAVAYESMLGNNLPLIEITDMNLSEDNSKTGNSSYIHQLRFYVFNVGKNSLKDVIISIKDIYNDPKDVKKRSRTIGQHDDEGINSDEQGIGTYENFEINTLNLKSRRLVYASTMPSSFGVAEYTFNVVVEWKGGFYQMEIRIEEFDGKLKYHFQYFDVNGNPINFDKLEKGIKK
jgi:hypothetical protein